MRKFYIEDNEGKRYDLNNQGDRIFLSNPSGLGMTMGSSFVDLQSGFFRDVAPEAEPQAHIVCDLVFLHPNAYERYREFTNWLNAASELFLIYVPFGTTEYYRRISVEYLTKTELTAGKWLTVPFSVSCLTPWYHAAPGALEITPSAANTVKYTFAYTPSLAYCSGRAGTMAAEVPADGHLPGAFMLSIKTALQNPVISLESATSAKVYGKCALNVSTAETDTLEISTRYGNSYVRKIAEDGTVTDLLGNVNLAFNPFPHIPLNDDCFISLTADNNISGTGTIQVYYYYRSV